MRYLTGDDPAAASLLERALALYRDLGYRPGEAEALNIIAKLGGQVHGATRGTRTAPHIPATGTTTAQSPGRSASTGSASRQLRTGEKAAALADLREAIAIYQRIGVPAAKTAAEYLDALENEHPDGMTAQDASDSST